MKLIIAIIRDTDSDPVIQALTSARFRVTRIASTGGVLKRGVTTLLIGVIEERLEAAFKLLHEKTAPVAKGEKRVTLFVVPVEKFTQI